MKKIIFIVSILLVLLNSGCKKCETTTHYDFPAATERYFGMYKMGNWWTYENQDGTKKDSIYLIELRDETLQDVEQNDCITWRSKSGRIKNNYLQNKVNLYDSYSNFYYSASKYNFISFELSSVGTPEYLANYDVNRFSNVDILSVFNSNNQNYNNVLKTKLNRYFAPNIGLIRWETTTDTFTLKLHHIQ